MARDQTDYKFVPGGDELCSRDLELHSTKGSPILLPEAHKYEVMTAGGLKVRASPDLEGQEIAVKPVGTVVEGVAVNGWLKLHHEPGYMLMAQGDMIFLDLPTSKQDKYRSDIDGLRALAVSAVVLFHFHRSWLPGGFVGVDIFFVISGYVVTGSVLQNMDKLSLEFAVGFYARRMKRLGPALVSVASTTGLLVALGIAPWSGNLDRIYMSGMLALIGWSPNYFATLHTSYFDEGVESLESNPFTHTWSLGVEEQYYLLFPVFIFFAYRARFSVDGKERCAWMRPKAVFLIGLACSACASGFLTINCPQLAFFTLPSRLWELMCGALLFELQFSSGSFRKLVGQPLVSAVLQLAATAFIVTALVITEEAPLFPMPWVLLAISGAVAFISAGLAPKSLLNRCFTCALPVYIGKISYPIYLWHWPILVVARSTVGLDLLSHRLACIGIVMLLAITTYHLVEKPFRSWRPEQHWHVFLVFVLALATSESWLWILNGPMRGKLFLGASQISPETQNFTVTQNFSETQNFTDRISSTCNSCQCQMLYYPDSHIPECGQPLNSSSDLPGCFNGPFINPQSATLPENLECCNLYSRAPCFYASKSAPSSYAESCLTSSSRENKEKVIYILGDSFAGHYVAAFRAFLGSYFTIRFWTITAESCGCGFLPMSLISAFAGDPALAGIVDCSEYQLCESYNSEALSALQQDVQEGDVVVISHSNRWLDCLECLEEFSSLDTSRVKIASDKFLPDFITKIQSLHNVTRSRGATLLLMGPTPILPTQGVKCIPSTWNPNAASACQISAAWLEANQSKTYDAALAELESRPSLLVYSSRMLNGVLCDDDGMCGAFIPDTNVLLSYDGRHLTEAASNYLGPFLCSFFAKHNLVAHSQTE